MAHKMPREIAPGVFWIGDCLAQRHKGKVYHGYNAAYLVAGTEASILIETGGAKQFGQRMQGGMMIIVDAIDLVRDDQRAGA